MSKSETFSPIKGNKLESLKDTLALAKKNPQEFGQNTQFLGSQVSQLHRLPKVPPKACLTVS